MRPSAQHLLRLLFLNDTLSLHSLLPSLCLADPPVLCEMAIVVLGECPNVGADVDHVQRHDIFGVL